MNKFHTWSIEPGSLEYPLVMAHRGGSDLPPENTIAAFRKAMGVGADGVEMDVRLTKDKEVVILHDRRLDRTTNGRGLVGTNTVREIKALDAGSWFGPGYKGEKVPTLAEVSGGPQNSDRWLREGPAPKIGWKQGAGHEANT